LLQTCLNFVFLSENLAFRSSNPEWRVERGFRGAGVPPAVFFMFAEIKNAGETPAPRKPAYFEV
jgi:hypothetical protein